MDFFKVPEALQSQHELLRQQLALAAAEGGRTGKAAEALVEVLRPHVVKEEDFALPALGLLQHLVAGKVCPVMRGVTVMTDRLKAQYEQMLADHELIVAAVRDLAVDLHPPAPMVVADLPQLSFWIPALHRRID